MTPKELDQGVQYMIDGNSEVTAVVVAPELWRKIIKAIEESEDRHLTARLSAWAPATPLDLSSLRLEEAEDWA
jgi:hypothetical protein